MLRRGLEGVETGECRIRRCFGMVGHACVIDAGV
jgi:hypothetical protein